MVYYPSMRLTHFPFHPIENLCSSRTRPKGCRPSNQERFTLVLRFIDRIRANLRENSDWWQRRHRGRIASDGYVPRRGHRIQKPRGSTLGIHPGHGDTPERAPEVGHLRRPKRPKGLSPGVQPGEPPRPRRRALKGRQTPESINPIVRQNGFRVCLAVLETQML